MIVENLTIKELENLKHHYEMKINMDIDFLKAVLDELKKKQVLENNNVVTLKRGK